MLVPVLSINTFGARFDIFDLMPMTAKKNTLFMSAPGTISSNETQCRSLLHDRHFRKINEIRRRPKAFSDRTATRSRADFMKTKILAVLILTLTLVGCVTGPSKGRADLLNFLADNQTTKEEVILNLGQPSGRFESEKILTYRLDICPATKAAMLLSASPVGAVNPFGQMQNTVWCSFSTGRIFCANIRWWRCCDEL